MEFKEPGLRNGWLVRGSASSTNIGSPVGAFPCPVLHPSGFCSAQLPSLDFLSFFFFFKQIRSLLFPISILPEKPFKSCSFSLNRLSPVSYTHKPVPPLPKHTCSLVSSAPSQLILITYGIQAEFDSLHLIDFSQGCKKKEEETGCGLTRLYFVLALRLGVSSDSWASSGSVLPAAPAP